MKINKKLTPINVAPVKRANVATVSVETATANAIAPSMQAVFNYSDPFAGDDAE